MLLSSSLPPLLKGMMWSGTVLAVVRPLAMQSLHRGSAYNRRSRCATALRPRSLGVPCSLFLILRSRGLGNYFFFGLGGGDVGGNGSAKGTKMPRDPDSHLRFRSRACSGERRGTCSTGCPILNIPQWLMLAMPIVAVSARLSSLTLSDHQVSFRPARLASSPACLNHSKKSTTTSKDSPTINIVVVNSAKGVKLQHPLPRAAGP